MFSYSLNVEWESNEMPINLDFIKQHFNIHPTQSDEHLKHILKLALKTAETYTDRSIIMKRFCYCNKQIKIHLPKPPINNIVSVSVADKEGFIQVKDFEQIVHHGYRTILLKEKYLNKKVKVIYEAGFDEESLPGSIQQYILDKFDEIYNGNSKSTNNNINILDQHRDMSNKL